MTGTGTRAVVTGAARGIGAAIAERLVREGWRVAVNDLDDAALAETADRIGALPLPGDCATQAGVTELVAAATATFGRVDAFMANAGTDAGAGLGTDDATWALVLEVNLMAHVRAARALLPGWLADGRGGRFVVTASAAGLLTMLGNAPYSVSKHAAVGFAEWLSATYADRGVVVQVLCPQGVRTRMLDGAGALEPLLVSSGALEPADVAHELWQAIGDDRFMVLPHPEVAGFYRHRAGAPDRWLGAMNDLQVRLGVPRYDGSEGPG